MPDSAGYLMDIPAIKYWAAAKGNEFKAVFEAVKAGTIVIYNRVWDKANEAYPDECSGLPKEEFQRQVCGEEHRLAAAALAQKLEATFPIRGSYDDAIEWTVIGIAVCGPYTIVTDQRRKAKYAKIDGLSVITYDELIDLL
jgi:hypothetical protein